MNILDVALAGRIAASGSGGGGTDNYNDLSNLPQINGETLAGNKSSSNLGLQDEIDSDNKLASDLVDDTNQDNKFVTSTEKNTWNGKQNAIDSDHKLSSDLVDDANKTNKFVTSTEKNTWNAKQNAIDSDHKLSSDLVDDTNKTNKFVTSTEKNTWNAKQNAIDADHKLSSSLVSFTEAEDAALASGINSSKVGQISTNQTNILYGLEHGSKNQLNFDGFEQSGTGITWKINDDKTITATGTATSLAYITLKLNNNYVYADALCDGLHYLSGCPTGGDFNTKYSLYLAKGSYNPVDTGVGILIPSTSETGVRVVIKIASGFAIPSGGITFKPMICLKSVYDAYPEYQSYGAPNYDLTRLEAEDRAALAEEIDAGAKNKLKYDMAQLAALNPSWTVSGSTIRPSSDTHITFTLNSDMSIRVQSDGSNAQAELCTCTSDYSLLKAGTYVLSGCPTGGDSSTTYDLRLIEQSSPKKYNADAGSGREITWSAQYTYTCNIMVRANQTIDKTFKPMICTKAAFGVSNKFVPYRPNYDLVLSKLSELGGMWCTRSFALGTGQYKFSFVIVKIDKSTSNSNRIPMRLSVGAQTLAASPVTIEWDFFAIDPSLSRVGMAFFKNETYPSSVPEVYFKADTTNKKCYVTVLLTNQSAMWGTAVLEWFYSPELLDFGISLDGTIDVSADAGATKMKLYAPAMTLLS